MIPGLEEIDAVVPDKIHDAVLLGQSSRPNARGKIFERFRFADSTNRIPHDCFDKSENTEGGSAVCFDPVLQVLNKFRLENSVTPFSNQVRPRDAAFRSSWVWAFLSAPVPGLSASARHF